MWLKGTPKPTRTITHVFHSIKHKNEAVSLLQQRPDGLIHESRISEAEDHHIGIGQASDIVLLSKSPWLEPHRNIVNHWPLAIKRHHERRPALTLIDCVIDEAIFKTTTTRKRQIGGYISSGSHTNTNHPSDVVAKIYLDVGVLRNYSLDQSL